MLSDEEKKAIDELKEEINKPLEVPEDKFDTFILYNIESAKIVLNLIEKQSKEIEHQIEKRENQKKELAILNAKQIEFNKLVNTVNSYKGQFKRQQKEIELLKEENEKYKNPPFFDEDEYTENDKIKAKIEEVSNGTYDAKIVLQSLLEKE